MPYTVIAPERKEFVLERSDAKHNVPPEEATRIVIKQATIRENANRSQLFTEFTTERQEDGKVREILRLPAYDLICREVFLTLVDCNIVTAEGKTFFRFKKNASGDNTLDMTLQQFQNLWGLLQEDVAMEIHEKVLEVNPNWRFSPQDTDLGEG